MAQSYTTPWPGRGRRWSVCMGGWPTGAPGGRRSSPLRRTTGCWPIVGAGTIPIPGPPTTRPAPRNATPPTWPRWAQARLRQNAPAMAVETATPITAYLPDLDPSALRALDKPVLLLGGDRSPAMYALERTVFLNLLPQAEAAIIPGTAHLMHAQ